MEIIPAIDLLGGRCVRLYQGDFGKVTTYDTDPRAQAALYARHGAQRLHVVDLDGAREGTAANRDIITRLAAESGLQLQVGGGIRSLESARSLLAAGVARLVVGSVAIRDPDTTISWLDALGADRLVLGLDVRIGADAAEPEAIAHGWRADRGPGLWGLAERYAKAGARHVLCTDIGRDGTLEGPSNELYAECVRRFPTLGWIASGGLGSAADLPTLAATGVAAVVTGKALLDGRLSLTELNSCSRAG
jgi:phosphoribosylformimino-5-aminoimidazole carboxamide ribotide isomerase